MKRTAVVWMILVIMLAMVAGCGNNNDAEGNKQNPPAASGGSPADGVYYAEGPYAESSGWKDIIALKVEGGKIVAVNWNALHKDGGLDKKTSSEKGIYAMVAKGGAQAEWHEQAAVVEQYLLEKQDPAAIVFNAEDGKTDAISGVSIHVNAFVELAAQALEAGPVTAGPYADGYYYAEAAEFDASSGWKETVDIAVMNGKIVAVSWNGVHKDGGTDKVTRSKSGEYGMVAKGNAKAEWHEQAAAAERFLLEKQDPAAIVFNAADGKTDAISGVSIHVNSFVELAGKALESAK